jgi:hypothetical protein
LERGVSTTPSVKCFLAELYSPNFTFPLPSTEVLNRSGCLRPSGKWS